MARVLFFGRLRDIAGHAARDLEGGFADVAALRAHLGAENAALGEALAAQGVRVAVDQEFADESTRLGAHSEIAFMAPLSGG